jgi:hypothetical protein
VFGSRGIRALVADMANQRLTISSEVALSSGTRSEWEVNTAFSSTAYLGAMRILTTGEIAVQNFTDLFGTGIFIGGGYHNMALEFDFRAATMKAFYDGAEIIADVPFDASNTLLAAVAFGTLITPELDAMVVDDFKASSRYVPEPGTALLLGLGVFGLVSRRRSRR